MHIHSLDVLRALRYLISITLLFWVQTTSLMMEIIASGKMNLVWVPRQMMESRILTSIQRKTSQVSHTILTSSNCHGMSQVALSIRLKQVRLSIHQLQRILPTKYAQELRNETNSTWNRELFLFNSPINRRAPSKVLVTKETHITIMERAT